MNDCIHELIWTEGNNSAKVWKLQNCAKCGEVVDVMLKDMSKPSKHQAYFDGMFDCFDAVTKRYPNMNEDNREAMAVSLFIQIARSV